eukprot:TRINITY_DN2708_c0_g1_i1.p1 TRINITY_DN2708_c0_g1~~TRINITY_DN2708_c0_g1_i1.p1  ORF type:complete len:190 (-),score=67.70 TRINITY_DN2708_c0_g1_i1:55-624(-)
MSRGKYETELLRQNIKDQLDRLFTQLEDLEELKDEFSDTEYKDTKQETLEQLRDFNEFLEKSTKGNMTLVDEFGAAQLAIQAAISNAFKTPEVIRMFAQKQDDQLKQKEAFLLREYKLKNIGQEEFNTQRVEVLVALKRLNVTLSTEQKSFLESMSSSRQLESAVDKLATGTQQNLVATAKTEIKKATT